MTPAVEAWSPNHWTTREFPVVQYLNWESHITPDALLLTGPQILFSFHHLLKIALIRVYVCVVLRYAL